MHHIKGIWTRKHKRKYLYVGLVGLIFLAVLPWVVNNYVLGILISVAFSAYLSQCWNVMSGYAGQFSFGHAAFFGLGAYTSSLLFVDLGLSPWLGMFAGVITAGTIGLIIGFLSFRYGIKGHYFSLATLAFAECLRVIFNNWPLAKGALGVLIPLSEGKWENFQFGNKVYYYYIILALTVLLTGFLKYLSKKKMGLYFVAIRENEDAAAALGVNVFKYKLVALGLSTSLTAIAGTFYAQYYLYIDPGITFGSDISISAILPTIIGGVGTVWGPILGSIILIPTSELTRAFLTNYSGMNVMLYGLILILVIMYLPEGAMGLIHKWQSKKKSDKPLEYFTGEEEKVIDTPHS